MLKWIIVVLIVILFIISYLTKFRSRNLFQGTCDNVWFPSQPHYEFMISGCHSYFFDYQSSNVILYCHGNYGNMSYYSHMPLIAQRLGISLLMFDYRGFGRSQGIPSTTTIKEDGINVYTWLTQYYEEQDIIVWGESLGGSIATWIAYNNKPGKLMLVSTFSDVHDVITLHHRDSTTVSTIVNIAGLLYDSLPIRLWIKHVKCPTCIVHSMQDTYIPYDCAVINAKAAKNLKEFIPIAGDHTTPEYKEEDIKRLTYFLEATLNIQELYQDLALFRQHSPLCQL